MIPVLPLDKMTIEEKLRVIEEVWEDLRRSPDSIPMPEWHLAVLREREKSIEHGTAKFIDLEIARREIDKELDEG